MRVDDPHGPASFSRLAQDTTIEEARAHSADTLPVAPASQLAPGPFDGYELLAPIGRGGMATVFRARCPAGREVALKVVRRGGERQSMARFLREGELTAALRHPGIIRVHSSGVVGEVGYLVYELVEGCRTLDEVLGEVGREEALRLILQAARALAYAHARGVVHRDVKPENLLVDARGRLRVADFGCAFQRDLERLTETGGILGTPLFMAPEQATGRRARIGPATDVWSLGLLIYIALTGEHPLEAASSSLPELLVAIVGRRLVPPRTLDPAIPRELEAVCLRALERDLAARYADAGELVADLERVLTATGPTPRRAWAPAVGAGALALAGGLTALLWLPVRAPAGGAPQVATEPPTESRAFPQRDEKEPAPAVVSAPVPVLSGAFEAAAEHVPPDRYPGANRLFRGLREDAERRAHPEALWLVGKLLADGQGVGRDVDAAVHWFRRAAAESPPHMVRLGRRLLAQEALRGEGVSWLRRAAARGSVPAMTLLGEQLGDDEGLSWAQRAAAHGDVDAIFALGYRHARGGPGVAQDLVEANRWLALAGERGHVGALALLARHRLDGSGGPVDEAEAARLLVRVVAAEDPPPNAFVQLGRLRRDGRGGPRDLDAARKLFRRGARAGLPDAMEHLAALLREGSASERAEARSWTKRARGLRAREGAR